MLFPLGFYFPSVSGFPFQKVLLSLFRTASDQIFKLLFLFHLYLFHLIRVCFLNWALKSLFRFQILLALRIVHFYNLFSLGYAIVINSSGLGFLHQQSTFHSLIIGFAALIAPILLLIVLFLFVSYR